MVAEDAPSVGPKKGLQKGRQWYYVQLESSKLSLRDEERSLESWAERRWSDLCEREKERVSFWRHTHSRGNGESERAKRELFFSRA